MDQKLLTYPFITLTPINFVPKRYNYELSLWLDVIKSNYTHIINSVLAICWPTAIKAGRNRYEESWYFFITSTKIYLSLMRLWHRDYILDCCSPPYTASNCLPICGFSLFDCANPLMVLDGWADQPQHYCRRYRNINWYMDCCFLTKKPCSMQSPLHARFTRLDKII